VLRQGSGEPGRWFDRMKKGSKRTWPEPDIRDIIGRWGEGRFRRRPQAWDRDLAVAYLPWIIVLEVPHDHYSLTAAHRGVAETG
jgi:hypothetical protein